MFDDECAVNIRTKYNATYIIRRRELNIASFLSPVSYNIDVSFMRYLFVFNPATRVGCPMALPCFCAFELFVAPKALDGADYSVVLCGVA